MKKKEEKEIKPKKEKVPKVKKEKIKKEKIKKEKVKKEKPPKKKRRIKSWILIFISTIFIIVGLILLLMGIGVIPYQKEKGPKLYTLAEWVRIGDYVDYDAGVWEEDKDIPNRGTEFTFGGYKKDVSRNTGVTCNYNDKENSGWRVFSNEDGVITLIQSGISMCYYHGYGASTNDRTVTILNNNDENIKYDYFKNDKFANNVKILSKEDIDKFTESDASFKRISNDLIAIDNPYWLASKYETYYMWYVTEGGSLAVDHVGSYGVRVLVTLNKGVQTTGQNSKKAWTLQEEVKNEKNK